MSVKIYRYTVDEIIPVHDDGYGPDGWVVLDMVREEEVASFLTSCPDARHHAYTLCADLNRMDAMLAS